MARHWIIVFFVSLAAGCAAPTASAPAPHPASRPTSQPTWVRVQMTGRPLGGDPRDPPAALPMLVHLDVSVWDLPAGTIARDAEFWRRVDEGAVGAANGERLLRNGVRCGVASHADWADFKVWLTRHSIRHDDAILNSFAASDMRLNMDQAVGPEDVFFFNAGNELEGRSYDGGTNGVDLRFGPTPRGPGRVLLTLCPSIRSERRRLEFTARNVAYTEPVEDVDRLYDAGLSVDVRDDSFLVVAPGPEASNAQSIGGRFFTRPDKTQRLDQVLIVIPSFLRMNGTPTTLEERAAK